MGRPRKVVPPVDAPPPPENAETPIRRRRRRRIATPPDYAAETSTVVEAVLRGRGAKGVTSEMLSAVVAWARGVRIEGDALRELGSRPRRVKTQAPIDRVATYDMNKALLDGIIAGTVALDIQEDGDLLFLSASMVVPAASTETE